MTRCEGTIDGTGPVANSVNFPPREYLRSTYETEQRKCNTSEPGNKFLSVILSCILLTRPRHAPPPSNCGASSRCCEFETELVLQQVHRAQPFSRPISAWPWWPAWGAGTGPGEPKYGMQSSPGYSFTTTHLVPGLASGPPPEGGAGQSASSFSS